MRAGLLSAALLAASTGLMAAPFSDGDTVVFLGDSITHGGRYHGFITDFYRTRYPDRKIRFVNSGIGGDSAIGAQKRLHEDVAEYRPTHVALHFGMNDVDREAYAVETTTDRLRRRSDAQARYRMNFDNLVVQVKAVAPQASLIYLSSTISTDLRPMSLRMIRRAISRSSCPVMSPIGRRIVRPVRRFSRSSRPSMHSPSPFRTAT